MPAKNDQTDAMERKLRDEERDTRAQLTRAQAELEAASEKDGVSDNADAAVATTLRDDLLARIERAQDHLAEVDLALGRIEAGTYGLCAVDGEPIEEARLQAVPWAEYCVRHQPASSDGDAPTL